MGFLDVVEPKAAASMVEGGLGACKVEPGLAEAGAFSSGPVNAAAPASKKNRVEAMPSKNLRAERRCRKRLNDRLSMLRFVVPKISKMDRTSILGDTIEYMKELLERIRQLQEEVDQQQETPAVLTVFRELNPNDMLARNTPKFEVERKEGGGTRVKIYCAAKPGLLMSTASTVETLSLDMTGLTPDVVFLHPAGRQMWSAPSCMLAAVLISSPVSKWLDLPSFASIRSPVCSLCSSPLLPSPTQPLLPLTSSRQNRWQRCRQEENSESAATACKRGFV